MDKKQFEKKVLKLFELVEPFVLNECKKALNTGAINVSECKNNFTTPKMFMHVALRNCSDRLFHLPGDGETAENLKSF